MAYLLLLAALCSQIIAIITSFLVVKKYESYLQKVHLKEMFDLNNFCAHRLWFIPLSIFVSFYFILVNARLTVETSQEHTLQYSLLSLLVGGLITQFNYFTLKDRRK